MYLYGASGHGKVIKEILNADGVKVEAFVDDNPNVDECGGCPVLHDATVLSPMIVSVGVNRIRKMIAERLIKNNSAIVFGKAIHPSAIISPTAKIGEGTVIMAGAVVNADAVIGKHCIINTGATVDHDCVIEDFCHIAPGTHISGATHVGEGTWIGVGSSVIQCLNIGKNCMIGAGSVVIKDIPDNVTAYGCPAKVKSNLKEDNMSRTKEGNPFGGGNLIECQYFVSHERRSGYAA